MCGCASVFLLKLTVILCVAALLLKLTVILRVAALLLKLTVILCVAALQPPFMRLSPPPNEHDYFYNLVEGEGACDMFDIPTLLM